MLVDAVEFEIAEKMVEAINAAALDSANFGGMHVTAVLDEAGDLDLSKMAGEIKVFVIPASATGTTQTLDGVEQDSVGIHVIVGKKLDETSPGAGPDEVRQLVSLCRSIWRVVTTETPDLMSSLIFQGRTTDPLYDHDAVRDDGEFFSDTEFTWQFSL